MEFGDDLIKLLGEVKIDDCNQLKINFEKHMDSNQEKAKGNNQNSVQQFENRFSLYSIVFDQFSQLLAAIDCRLETLFIDLYQIMITFLNHYSQSVDSQVTNEISNYHNQILSLQKHLFQHQKQLNKQNQIQDQVSNNVIEQQDSFENYEIKSQIEINNQNQIKQQIENQDDKQYQPLLLNENTVQTKSIQDEISIEDDNKFIKQNSLVQSSILNDKQIQPLVNKNKSLILNETQKNEFIKKQEKYLIQKQEQKINIKNQSEVTNSSFSLIKNQLNIKNNQSLFSNQQITSSYSQLKIPLYDHRKTSHQISDQQIPSKKISCDYKPEEFKQKGVKHICLQQIEENLKTLQQKDFIQTKQLIASKLKQFQQKSKQKNKNLTLKQLKDLILEIYDSKQLYDQKQIKLPPETLNSYIQLFLTKKYGLKSLVNEWFEMIQKGVEIYQEKDIDIKVFGKILDFKCDEEFQFVIGQVKQGIQELLRLQLRSKMRFKSEKELDRLTVEKQNLDQNDCQEIIQHVFGGKVYKFDQEQGIMEQLSSLEGCLDGQKVTFQSFQNILLNQLLNQHLTYFKPISTYFQQIDQKREGIITHNQFQDLLQNFPPLIQHSQKFIQLLDPYSHNRIVFSKLANLFSVQTIQYENKQLPLIQYINLKY